MRLPLAIALILLFLWLHKAQMSNGASHGHPCEALSVREAAVSLLLSPLSLFSWLASALLTLVLSVPALVLRCLHLSVLLLLAWPCCVANACVSLLLACLYAALCLLQLLLVVGAVVALTLARRKVAPGADRGPRPRKSLEGSPPETGLRAFARRAARRG